MSTAASIQHFAKRLGPVGVAAILCGLGTTVVFAVAGSTLLSAATVPSATLVEQAEKERQDSESKFKLAFDGNLQQINGRSLFLVPGRPPAKEAPPTVVVDDTPKVPPPPSTYGGPSIIAMMNGSVWFSDGKRLGPGEGDSELKVVELKAPWGAVVKWKDVQFTVGLFDRETDGNPLAPKTDKPKPPPESTEALMGPEAPADAFQTDHPAEGKPDPKAPLPEALPPRPPGQARAPQLPPRDTPSEST